MATKRVVSAETRAKMAAARAKWWAEATPEKREALTANQRGPRPQTSAALKGKPRAKRGTTAREMPCATCGAPVMRFPYQIATHPHAFCNRACFHVWYSEQKRIERPTFTCRQCGAVFERLASREKWNKGKHFCSRVCANAGRSGAGHPAWQGGRHRRTDGYVDVNLSLVASEFRGMTHDGRRVMEHRLVMAQHLGRPLEPWEVVHHVNGQRDDNRIENLELHGQHEHTGITAMSRRDQQIAALRAQIEQLEQERDARAE